MDESKLGKNQNDIYYALYDIFTDLFPSKSLDIIFLQRSNLELCFDVISHGQIIFQSQPEDNFNFEEKTSLLYADFFPLLKEFNRAVLERVA